jgi:hypothetical protein
MIYVAGIRNNNPKTAIFWYFARPAMLGGSTKVPTSA